MKMTMKYRIMDNIDSMPYAIDAKLCNKGRRFAATKRRLEFHFGFGNKEAIERGLSSSECRGEEHQVVMIWSLTSGKQRVLADGIEVHFSRRSVTDKFECKWTMKSGHQITIESSWAPLAKNVRNFDLRIDGLSFWKMPKIYQLGSANRGMAAPRRRCTAALIDRQSPCSSTCEGSISDSISVELATAPNGSRYPNQQRQTRTYSNQLQRAQSAPTAPLPPPTVTAIWDDLLVAPMPPSQNPFSPPSAGINARSRLEEQSPMDIALKSLVNMDASAPPPLSPSSSYSLSLSRSPSISDLSVQSAYTPHQRYSQCYDLNYSFHNSYGWQSQHYPVYSFAG